MPRQAYLKVVPNPRGAKIDIGVHAIGYRPKLEVAIAHCAMAWPNIEVQMTMVLGHLLKAKNLPALAVFHSLRRSSAQREAIAVAGEAALRSRKDRELLD